ncbi:hypothetical protein BGZ94_003280 [Podila epigama]|nr:hypothetical protein BGZ94_003280 [Podila epigama]
MSRLQEQDLSQLQQPTEDSVTTVLANRFQQGQIYTRIASSVLVQVNPFHPGRVELSEETLQNQVLTYKDGARLVGNTNTNTNTDHQQASTTIPLPHVIQVATSAYLHMRRTGQDQSIITM